MPCDAQTGKWSHACRPVSSRRAELPRRFLNWRCRRLRFLPLAHMALARDTTCSAPPARAIWLLPVPAHVGRQAHRSIPPSRRQHRSTSSLVAPPACSSLAVAQPTGCVPRSSLAAPSRRYTPHCTGYVDVLAWRSARDRLVSLRGWETDHRDRQQVEKGVRQPETRSEAAHCRAVQDMRATARMVL